jgi:hypothetical protein
MGPFEWLLRSFTYWKWQPLRRPLQMQFDNEKQLVTASAQGYYEPLFKKILKHFF